MIWGLLFFGAAFALGAVGGYIAACLQSAEDMEPIRHAARVLTRPMEFTTDEYVEASALLKALAEEAT